MQIYDTNTLEKAISKYGKDSQVDMAVEEMSELVKALLKDRRAMRNPAAWDYERIYQNICEEIADVLIMLEQLMMIFNCEKEVEGYIRAKIERLKKRLEAEEDVQNGRSKEMR